MRWFSYLIGAARTSCGAAFHCAARHYRPVSRHVHITSTPFSLILRDLTLLCTSIRTTATAHTALWARTLLLVLFCFSFQLCRCVRRWFALHRVHCDLTPRHSRLVLASPPPLSLPLSPAPTHFSFFPHSCVNTVYHRIVSSSFSISICEWALRAAYRSHPLLGFFFCVPATCRSPLPCSRRRLPQEPGHCAGCLAF